MASLYPYGRKVWVILYNDAKGKKIIQDAPKMSDQDLENALDVFFNTHNFDYKKLKGVEDEATKSVNGVNKSVNYELTKDEKKAIREEIKDLQDENKSVNLESVLNLLDVDYPKIYEVKKRQAIKEYIDDYIKD